MKFGRVLFFFTLLFVAEGRPQPHLAELKGIVTGTGSTVSSSVKKIGQAISSVSKGTLQEIRNVGSEVGTLVNNVLDSGAEKATGMTRAAGDIAKEGVSSARKIVDASKNYAKDNLYHIGEFAGTTVDGQLGTIVAAAEATGNYAGTMTGATIGLTQRVLGAGGKLIIDAVGSAVDLAKGAGGVVGDMSGKVIEIVTGYSNGDKSAEIIVIS